MDANQELKVIREIVRRQFRRNKGVTFTDDTPLVSGGLIDSMSLVDVILDLQLEFSVTIPTSEVQPDDFDSVQKIAGTVARFR